MQDFTGKVAVITGASSGIGRAAALRLAALGADVALAARTETALHDVASHVRALGRRALVLPTDVAEPESCRRMVETAVDQLGRLDIMLCCAGISMRTTFAESDPAVMEKVMRVNFFGTMHASWHAIPHLRRTRGSLVALSSLTGKRGTPFYSVYGASKFAIQGLFESLPWSWRRMGFTSACSPPASSTRHCASMSWARTDRLSSSRPGCRFVSGRWRAVSIA